MGRTKATELNERQRAFVCEYLRNGGDGAAAARAVGYCPNSPQLARNQAAQLMRNPLIAGAVASGRGEIQAVIKYDAKAAVAELDRKIAGAEAAKNWNAVANLMRSKLQITGHMANVDPKAAAGFQVFIGGIDDARPAVMTIEAQPEETAHG